VDSTEETRATIEGWFKLKKQIRLLESRIKGMGVLLKNMRQDIIDQIDYGDITKDELLKNEVMVKPYKYVSNVNNKQMVELIKTKPVLAEKIIDFRKTNFAFKMHSIEKLTVPEQMFLKKALRVVSMRILSEIDKPDSKLTSDQLFKLKWLTRNEETEIWEITKETPGFVKDYLLDNADEPTDLTKDTKLSYFRCLMSEEFMTYLKDLDVDIITMLNKAD